MTLLFEYARVQSKIKYLKMKLKNSKRMIQKSRFTQERNSFQVTLFHTQNNKFLWLWLLSWIQMYNINIVSTMSIFATKLFSIVFCHILNWFKHFQILITGCLQASQLKYSQSKQLTTVDWIMKINHCKCFSFLSHFPSSFFTSEKKIKLYSHNAWNGSIPNGKNLDFRPSVEYSLSSCCHFSVEFKIFCAKS